LNGAGGAKVKDKLENKLHSLVCSGQISLAAAQQAISGDWGTAYAQYVAVAAVPTQAPAPAYTQPAPAYTAPAPAGGSDVYYANCTAAKAAGAAPIYRGQPGYRSGLDRDDDGIACET
jgi:Excalibur calcium-binding domain